MNTTEEYKGCRNCKYQLEPMQTCDWIKHQKEVYRVCPMWELKENKGGGMMERLTNNIDFCKMHCDLGGVNDCLYSDKSKCYENNIYNRLREYEIAEEQGLLLRLPCKVGDTVYRINKGAKEPIIKMRIFQVHIKQLHKNRTIIRIDTINDEDMGEGCYLTDDFGKNVFLTKSEAEQKLKEMESD